MYTVAPIAHVHGGRADPRDDQWSRERARIELVDSFSAEALTGIEEFSRVEVVYLFDRVQLGQIESGSHHPRGRMDWPRVGIFAQRAKDRPNRLGVSVVRLLSRQGRAITVQGLDAIDGTPVLDIKPVMAEFLPQGPIHPPPWSRELMKHYWV